MEQIISFLSDNLIIILISIAGMCTEPLITIIFLLGILIWGQSTAWLIVAFVLTLIIALVKPVIKAIFAPSPELRAALKKDDEDEDDSKNKWDM